MLAPAHAYLAYNRHALPPTHLCLRPCDIMSILVQVALKTFITETLIGKTRRVCGWLVNLLSMVDSQRVSGFIIHYMTDI